MHIFQTLKYAYLIGTLIFFIPWTILFLLRKDLRKEMLLMGSIVAILGIIFQYFWWTFDWWHPETITGTRIGIEDLLLGFSNGGIAAVLYEVVFKKRLYKRKSTKQKIGGWPLILLGTFIASLLFWGIGLTSYTTTIITALSIEFLLIHFRPNLLVNALASGLLMALVSLPIYYSLIILYPSWVQTTWLLENLSGAMVTGIPVEDIVFYFLVGFVAGPFYEYWQDLRLRNIGKQQENTLKQDPQKLGLSIHPTYSRQRR